MTNLLSKPEIYNFRVMAVDYADMLELWWFAFQYGICGARERRRYALTDMDRRIASYIQVLAEDYGVPASRVLAEVNNRIEEQ